MPRFAQAVGLAFGRSSWVLGGLGSELQSIGFADVLVLALGGELGAGLFGVGLQELVYFLTAIHGSARLVDSLNSVGLKYWASSQATPLKPVRRVDNREAFSTIGELGL
jgi:hypothetical protein